MILCGKCHGENTEGSQFCQFCGSPLVPSNPAAPGIQQPIPPAQNMAPPKGAYPPPYPGSRPPVPPQPVVVSRPKKSFTVPDVCSIIGFVSGIVGIFYFWLILVPVGLICSIIGYRGDKTKGIAVAGIVISAIALLIGVGLSLYHLNLLPDWLISGIWG